MERRNTNRRKAAAAILMTLTLAACATTGRRIDVDAVEQLEPGTATKADAVQLLGEPTSKSVAADGTQVYGWTYAKVNGVSGRTESTAVFLSFSKDGTLIRRSVANPKTP